MVHRVNGRKAESWVGGHRINLGSKLRAVSMGIRMQKHNQKSVTIYCKQRANDRKEPKYLHAWVTRKMVVLLINWKIQMEMYS